MGAKVLTLLWVTFLSSSLSMAEESSPFFLAKENFTYTSKTPRGSFKLMDSSSDLNFRVAILEANPHTYALPSHLDADELLYVIKGKGVITQMPHGNKDSNKQEIVEGDVLWIPAGTVVDLVNVDGERSLKIVLFLKAISSTSGDYKEFFGAGGVEPESFLRSFSTEITGAAFNSRRDELEKILSSQRKGAFVEATEDQIQALTRGQRARHKISLLSKKPAFSNSHGQMYELTARDYPSLWLLDADVSFANISAGSMIAPFFNSKATKVAFVVSGKGYVEIVQQKGQSYKKAASKVSTGDVFLIVAGEPVTTFALREEGLQVLCFGLNAEENHRVFLSGENGVLKELEREVKEMSFGVPVEEVDEVVKAQRESVFMEGPKEVPLKREDLLE